MNFPIDAVIEWVDGNDPKLLAKRMEYLPDKEMAKVESIASSKRYESFGEIFWCVGSLNKFAPWLRKIWIITDGQDPDIEDFLLRNFPDKRIPYQIVDHKEIFRGYERFLPTFNSNAIESMSWRIEGLSEHFIELNDDFMLAAPVTPGDFFTPDGAPICYGRVQSIWWTRFTRKLKHGTNGLAPVTYKGSLVNAAAILGEKRKFIRIHHTPRAMLASFFREYYASHPEVLLRNIGDRFRSAGNYVTHELEYLYLWRRGKCEVRPFGKVLLYMKPTRRKGESYIAGKLEKLAKGGYKFVCFNSIDEPSAVEIRAFLEKSFGFRLS